ncbi:MAG: cation diffusion facilitator family transporter [Candidatus Kapabacteria bacterium]|nr:cation diffusion facilitator family transporter [Candidatus Kapabacteria bacterium]
MTLPVANWRRTVRALLTRGRPEFASTVSLLACTLLALGSIALGVIQRSLIMQTNGYIALIDIGNSLLFLAAVQRSSRQADVTFNYGYGKYESLAILVSANLLIVLTIFTLGEAFSFARRPPVDVNSVFLAGWAMLSFVVMRYTARLLERYANRFHMPMLRYDAELWRADSWMELGVLSGIGISAALRTIDRSNIAAILDIAASIILLLVALRVPLKHGREAFRQLLDRTLPDQAQYEILAIIAENVRNMCAFNSVHTRQSGRDIFIEIDLVMPFDYTLGQLYELERSILDNLRAKFPTAIPRVYVTPCDRSCEHDGVSSCPIKVLRQG